MPEISPWRPSRFWPDGLAPELGELPRSLAACLEASVRRRPDHLALVFYGLELTYAELWARVERLAGFLRHRCGVRRGDRVLIDMQNSPHFVIAFQAILRADAVATPVNPMNLTEELAWFCADSGARAALVGGDLASRFADLQKGLLDHVIVADYGDELPDPPQFRLPDVIRASAAAPPPGMIRWVDALAETRSPGPSLAGPEDLAIMPYSSGTTGRPKGCAHSHANALTTAIGQARWYELGEDSVLSAFMPLFHVAGMQVSMHGGLAVGATLVLMARWDRDLIPPLFERYGVTFWSAAPTMVVDALASPDFTDKTFARLKVITGGGSTMPSAVAAELKARFGLTFVEGYGLTETIAATHLNPIQRAKPQCLGIPFYETVSLVVDPETLAERPTGETGEILISGPQVMQGYWGRPDADAEAFVEIGGRRFLRTGDLGYMDDEGYHFIVDRLKRMINVSGYKVWPAEVEATLYRHPAIQECCVIAAKDTHRGETVKAVVVLKPGADLDEAGLMAWARGAMAAYKIPRAVAFADHLPRTGSNKIDWRRLQEAEA